MNRTDTLAAVRAALHEVAPEADLDRLEAATDIREFLELDSLDFLRFVELLSERTGRRIDEDDCPRLATTGQACEFLAHAA
ncbi:acyl carrier protein [Paractinoplanes hotanensis]|uniref:Phosphopantetheine-binding protein n=1 Tax=Paractinoplanes hotanensis TaxID=2906497 RepID=A0ABT0Y5F0_9ACTN|nr:phosphopantetheine-binding protein [Actinoplanes hotanensis]MCM4081269.1 phosphopantetheine-binding protein [Actinoplanes hotanensis]